MIEINTLRAVEYSPLDESEFLVVAKNGSPLEEIIATLSPDALLTRDTVDSPTIEVLSAHSEQYEEHAEELAKLKELGLMAVRNISAIVKNTINPHIHSVVKAIEQLGDHSEIKTSWSISPQSLPALIETDFAKQILPSLVQAGLPTVKLSGIGTLTNEQVIQLALGSNTDGHNDLVATAIESSEKGERTVRLSDIFRTGKIPDENGIEEAYIAALALSNLKTPSPDTNLSLNEWDLQRRAIMTACAKVVLQATHKYTREIELTLLYTKAPLRQPGVIEVNAEVYRRLISNGVTPEVVIGNEITQRRYPAAQLPLPQVIDALTKVYNTDRAAFLAARSLSNQTYRINSIQNALRNDLTKRAESQEWPVDGDTKEKAWVRLKTITEKILTGPFKDAATDQIVAAIIIATWYAHTDAVRFLDIANRISTMDDRLSEDEIFALTKVEYVGEWVADLLDVAYDDTSTEDLAHVSTKS